MLREDGITPGFLRGGLLVLLANLLITEK
jgi:hypothetical protein